MAVVALEIGNYVMVQRNKRIFHTGYYDVSGVPLGVAAQIRILGVAAGT